MSGTVKLRDMSRNDREPLIHLENEDLMPLPAPLDVAEKDRAWACFQNKASTGTNAGWTIPAR